jgi:hypothetical protein
LKCFERYYSGFKKEWKKGKGEVEKISHFFFGRNIGSVIFVVPKVK